MNDYFLTALSYIATMGVVLLNKGDSEKTVGDAASKLLEYMMNNGGCADGTHSEKVD